ncbi:MAG: hypothetical protein IJU53_05160 [Thermoguttaceae bacterium]|nr:hypothetical protein [Thermoguttaceae bacterium]
MNLRSKINLMAVYVGFLVFVLALFVFLLGVRFGFEYAYPAAKLNSLQEINLETRGEL